MERTNCDEGTLRFGDVQRDHDFNRDVVRFRRMSTRELLEAAARTVTEPCRTPASAERRALAMALDERSSATVLR